MQGPAAGEISGWPALARVAPQTARRTRLVCEAWRSTALASGRGPIDLRGRLAPRDPMPRGGSRIEIGRLCLDGFVVEAVVPRRRRQRRATHRKAHAGEDRLRGLGSMNCRDDPHRSAAARTLEDVDREDPFHEFCPREPPRPSGVGVAGTPALAIGRGAGTRSPRPRCTMIHVGTRATITSVVGGQCVLAGCAAFHARISFSASARSSAVLSRSKRVHQSRDSSFSKHPARLSHFCA